MIAHQYGESAVLVDTAPGLAPGLAAVARAAFGAELLDAVPTATCLLLSFAGPVSAASVAAVLGRSATVAGVTAGPGRPQRSAEGRGPHHAAQVHSDHHSSDTTSSEDAAGLTTRCVTIPVSYDGPDLADVARLAGLAESDVVALHTAAEFRVEFFGFAPGFAYLTGLPAPLQLPRRATPRTQVPAGAVAIAAAYSAVYPRPSPGGWHLLGTTPMVMFDAEAETPTPLRPGDHVRFEALP